MRAAQIDWFARDACRFRMADVHRVGVHDPGHGLLIGIHIRRRHIALRADVIQDFRRVAPGNALQFPHRELGGITDNTAFGSSKGDIDDRALPGHFGGQASNFVQRHIRRVAKATLARPPSDTVLHAVAVKNSELSIVHRHWNVHDEFPIWATQVLLQTLVQL